MTDKEWRKRKGNIKIHTNRLLDGVDCETTEDINDCREYLKVIRDEALWLGVELHNELKRRGEI